MLTSTVPRPQPENMLRDAAWGGAQAVNQAADIETVMVDGRFIMRDHRVLTVDEDAIMEEAARISERVWNRILRDGELPLPRLG